MGVVYERVHVLAEEKTWVGIAENSAHTIDSPTCNCPEIDAVDGLGGGIQQQADLLISFPKPLFGLLRPMNWPRGPLMPSKRCNRSGRAGESVD